MSCIVWLFLSHFPPFPPTFPHFPPFPPISPHFSGAGYITGTLLGILPPTLSGYFLRPHLAPPVRPETAHAPATSAVMREVQQDPAMGALLLTIGGALSAMRAQCNYLGVWPY